jgi:hypothetical protein
LDYVCGPTGVPVPISGNYIVKPITNIGGMGVGSSIHPNVQSNEIITPVIPGYFWVEQFAGDHISVDYVYGVPTLGLLGHYHSTKPLTFDRWTRYPLKSVPTLPTPIQDICSTYAEFNVEFVGGNVIEVHCRSGGDSWIFNDLSVDYIIPVWENDIINPTDEFVPSYEPAAVNRLGFIVVRV